MCGIAGILKPGGQRVEPDEIRVMTEAMVHRGPDDHGLFLDGGLGFGHRRLSIIDRSAGHQPMCNEDETVWIVFNGEIYNYQGLREELIGQGHRFRTHADTEVIVHLYEELGPACVHRLEGMFAFAIWDRTTATLFVARDRMGIKPLYYHWGPRGFAFASEARPLLALDWIPDALNLQAIHDYLTYRYTPAPDTAWQGIHKLPPAHHMIIREGSCRVAAYWELDFNKKLALPEHELIDECYARLLDSTRQHLVGEVPHGVFLSGGVDSTVMTALVAQLSGRRVKTYSVGFASELGGYHDELPYARLAAQAFDTDHHEVVMSGRDYVDGLESFIRHIEEPMGDPSAVPLFVLSKLARQSVTIMLSGEGSDELLAGYSFEDPLRGYHRAAWFRRIPSALRRWILAPANGWLGSPRLARYLELANRPTAHYFQYRPSQMTSIFTEEAKRALYSEALAGLTFRESEALTRELYRQAARFEPLDQMLYVYAKQWLPDDLLLKADKMTMAHSVELRVPFLHHPFVEFAAALPEAMKLRRTGRRRYVGKYILKQAMRGRIPDAVLDRPKLGFAVPVWSLFDSDLRGVAWDVVRSQVVRDSGLFDQRKLSRALGETADGRGGDWWYLWPILVLGLWLTEFHRRPMPSMAASSSVSAYP